MFEAIAKFGIRGSVGLLLGLLADFWISPKTPEGTAVVLLFFILIAIIIASIFDALKRVPKKQSALALPDKKEDKPKIWLPGDKN